MSSYLLIDASYMVFYRYYAVKSWFKKAHPDQEDDHDIIIQKFNQRFLETIDELSKKYNTPYKNIFLCCDCPQNRIWRKNIYKEYKSTRRQDHEVSKAFISLLEQLYPILNLKGVQIFKCDTAEADDIIAILTKQLQVNNQVIIITSDEDYLQLLSPTTMIRTLAKKKNNLGDKSLGDSSLDLQVKIIMGDKSDNIHPCFPRCGKKTAIKYIKEDLLKQKFKSYPGSQDIYNLNQRIIDFNFIPKNIKENILSQLESIKS